MPLECAPGKRESSIRWAGSQDVTGNSTEGALMTGEIDVRLVVADMDGTLLDDAGSVPEGMWPLVERMEAAGIVFAPASGRQYATLAKLFERTGDRLAYIAENGLLAGDADLLDRTTPQTAESAGLEADLMAANLAGHEDFLAFLLGNAPASSLPPTPSHEGPENPTTCAGAALP